MKKRRFLSGFLATLMILNSSLTIALAETSTNPLADDPRRLSAESFTIGWDGYDPNNLPVSSDPLFVNDTGILTISDAADTEVFKWQNEDNSIIVLEPENATSPFGIIFSGFGGIFASSKMKVTAVGAGSSTVSVSDEKGNTITKEITVIDNLVESMYISMPPEKTDYTESEIFDPIGMAVKAIYTNGDERFLKQYSFSRNPLVAGQTTVTLNYTEKEVSKSVDIPITVNAIYRTIVAIPSENGLFVPNKTEGVAGDIISLDVAPTVGYEMDKIIVNGELTKESSFILPDENVIVEVTFRKISNTQKTSSARLKSPTRKH